MGRKSFFQNAKNRQKCLEHYAANGYVSRAYIEEDTIRKKHDRTDKVKQLQKEYEELYKAFGIGIRDDNRLQFASGLLLLVIAIRHGALYGIDTLDNIAEYDFRYRPRTEILLRWKTEALEVPVFRNVTA
ncbi:uncharacterized protein KD926_001999 [Aspergillus affinis]|uniref:uncharacterized protein n=1 Tax=Aspergillus affinis TaxID=1070780 RepID=UPI0022FDCFBE|nr:uncharacterized protein KD926_001999 [Aspergillus affinis]KAI9044175.1 hypothetical protein KD926_001999 [Aspergillus affinis]